LRKRLILRPALIAALVIADSALLNNFIATNSFGFSFTSFMLFIFPLSIGLGLTD
jgi:hypothetical protein